MVMVMVSPISDSTRAIALYACVWVFGDGFGEAVRRQASEERRSTWRGEQAREDQRPLAATAAFGAAAAAATTALQRALCVLN